MGNKTDIQKAAGLAFIVMVLILVIGLFSALLIRALNTPVVQKDAITQECVKVLPQGSCSNLPDTYSTEWVRGKQS